MIMELFRAAYYRQIPLPESDEDWSNCLTQLEEESLLPQAYWLMKNLAHHHIPAFVTAFLKRGANAALSQSLILKYESQTIFAVLEQNEIDVIPLKGTLFAERYFGHLSARSTSDIDLLFQENDVSRAISCLREIGFSGPYDFNPLHFHCVMKKHLQGLGTLIMVEIHWNLVQDRTSMMNLNQLWTHAKPIASYKHVKELTTQHTFYAICLHGANHFMDSPKYVIDVVQILYFCGEEIDYAALAKQSASDRTRLRVAAVLSHVYSLFPELKNEKPLLKELTTRKSVYRKRVNLILLDSWLHKAHVLCDVLWPPEDVARWHVRGKVNSKKAQSARLLFYKDRVTRLISRLKRLAKIHKEGEQADL